MMDKGDLLILLGLAFAFTVGYSVIYGIKKDQEANIKSYRDSIYSLEIQRKDAIIETQERTIKMLHELLKYEKDKR